MKNSIIIGFLVVVGVVIIGGGLIFIARGTSYNLTVTDPSKGPDDAPIVIEEYSDFECPACAASASVIREVIKQYPNQVKFVYRDFPLPSHSKAQPAAIGALCAAQQGKFWEFHDRIFEDQEAWAAPGGDIELGLSNIADEFGLNKEDWEMCKNSQDARQAVQDDVDAGQEMGINSTPTFYLNGKKFETPSSLFAWTKLIDQALEEKGLVAGEDEESGEPAENVDNTDESADTNDATDSADDSVE